MSEWSSDYWSDRAEAEEDAEREAGAKFDYVKPRRGPSGKKLWREILRARAEPEE